MALASCHCIEHSDNVIVLGPPGVGIGVKANEPGYRVLLASATHLIAALTTALFDLPNWGNSVALDTRWPQGAFQRHAAVQTAGVLIKRTATRDRTTMLSAQDGGMQGVQAQIKREIRKPDDTTTSPSKATHLPDEIPGILEFPILSALFVRLLVQMRLLRSSATAALRPSP